jgi:hypothetical protein
MAKVEQYMTFILGQPEQESLDRPARKNSLGETAGTEHIIHDYMHMINSTIDH